MNTYTFKVEKKSIQLNPAKPEVHVEPQKTEPDFVHQDYVPDPIDDSSTLEANTKETLSLIEDIPHVDFIIPNKFYAAMGSMRNPLLLSCLPIYQCCLTWDFEFPRMRVFVLRHYKTRGRVFLNAGENDADDSKSQWPFILLEYIYINNERLGLDMMQSK